MVQTQLQSPVVTIEAYEELFNRYMSDPYLHGSFLRQFREYNGLAVVDELVSRETKISMPYNWGAKIAKLIARRSPILENIALRHYPQLVIRVPSDASDGASDDVFEDILSEICPYVLHKTTLSVKTDLTSTDDVPTQIMTKIVDDLSACFEFATLYGDESITGIFNDPQMIHRRSEGNKTAGGYIEYHDNGDRDAFLTMFFQVKINHRNQKHTRFVMHPEFASVVKGMTSEDIPLITSDMLDQSGMPENIMGVLPIYSKLMMQPKYPVIFGDLRHGFEIGFSLCSLSYSAKLGVHRVEVAYGGRVMEPDALKILKRV